MERGGQQNRRWVVAKTRRRHRSEYWINLRNRPDNWIGLGQLRVNRAAFVALPTGRIQALSVVTICCQEAYPANFGGGQTLLSFFGIEVAYFPTKINRFSRAGVRKNHLGVHFVNSECAFFWERLGPEHGAAIALSQCMAASPWVETGLFLSFSIGEFSNLQCLLDSQWL